MIAAGIIIGLGVGNILLCFRLRQARRLIAEWEAAAERWEDIAKGWNLSAQVWKDELLALKAGIEKRTLAP